MVSFVSSDRRTVSTIAVLSKQRIGTDFFTKYQSHICTVGLCTDMNITEVIVCVTEVTVVFKDCFNEETILLRKEVIQPHLPIRLPCYDLAPVTDFAFDAIASGFGHPRLPWLDGRCVQGPGTYSP